MQERTVVIFFDRYGENITVGSTLSFFFVLISIDVPFVGYIDQLQPPLMNKQMSHPKIRTF